MLQPTALREISEEGSDSTFITYKPTWGPWRGPNVAIFSKKLFNACITYFQINKRVKVNAARRLLPTSSQVLLHDASDWLRDSRQDREGARPPPSARPSRWAGADARGGALPRQPPHFQLEIHVGESPPLGQVPPMWGQILKCRDRPEACSLFTSPAPLGEARRNSQSDANARLPNTPSGWEQHTAGGVRRAPASWLESMTRAPRRTAVTSIEGKRYWLSIHGSDTELPLT